MIWAIWCRDAHDAAAKREQASKDHSKHLDASPIVVLMAGPLTTDDGANRNGSLVLLRADDREAVETFVHSDPFFQRGVWESVVISAFHVSRNNLAEPSTST